jgi:ribosomal protein S18 acetylase RimI-like enzyme
MIIHSDEISVYGYFNDDKLDGIIRVDEFDDCYELSFFFVNKDCQRQGIGQYLLRWIIKRFKDKKLSLSVYTDNSPAIHIYKKYGFKTIRTAYGVGYRPKAPYYIMQRDID